MARRRKKRVSLKKLHRDIHHIHQGLKRLSRSLTLAQRRKLNLMVRSLAEARDAVADWCPTRTFGPL